MPSFSYKVKNAIQNIQYSIIYSETITGVLITWKVICLCVFSMYVCFCITLCIQVVCSSHAHDYYIVTHNVSVDQSPITVNRTSVTLYGVQPGETYTVEIIPCRTHHCLLLVSNALLIEGIIHCQQLTVNE